MAFGVLSAATVVWLKKGDPDHLDPRRFRQHPRRRLLPARCHAAWMQKVSLLIPITYSLDALRLTMLRGQSLIMVAKPLAMLTAMTAILLPASLGLFAAAVRRGRREGTLMEY